MDLKDVAPTPAPRVQKTVDRIKKSKSAKTVPFHNIKRNPYLDMDTGDDTVEQSGVNYVPGTVKTSVEVGGSNQIPWLRQNVGKITPFKPPLKRKCQITDCIQCNMKKCLTALLARTLSGKKVVKTRNLVPI